MGKRKHLHSSETASSKRNRVEVLMEDLSSHPRCVHGPTLLFSGERGQFYACASCRNRECPVRINREDWDDPRVRENNKKFEKLAKFKKLDKKNSWETLQKLSTSEMSYCATCDALYAVKSNLQHLRHRIVSPLSKEQLTRASSWLPPLENNSREAQYLFSEEAVHTLLNAVRNNNIRNVLCIGTPSIHEAAQRSGDMSSILLDLDFRHRLFWPPDKFARYNIFNHHFFDGKEDEVIFEKFLKSSVNNNLCIVLDPPFGGRVEPIAYTLRTISAQYHKLHGTACALVSVVWVFPYFSEPYITNLLPELRMHDYQVTYNNHTKFKINPKKPSPVRIYTNLPHKTVDLSDNGLYKHCKRCDKWVSVANEHCAKCDGCTSKNGTTYEHCDACARCVKATFFHCATCGRCCQRKGHVCGVAVQVQSCYNCSEKGHKRVDCPLLKMSKTQNEDETNRKKKTKIPK